jgi:ppGpp synthetase/RelA/SpoT-type nucleotidyltranferase
MMNKLNNRAAVIESYAYEAMEDMDMRVMCTFVQDTIEDELKQYTDQEIIDILDGSPYEHILEGNVEET